MRLFQIGISVCFCVAFSLISLRQCGLGQQHQAFEHPVLEMMSQQQKVRFSETGATVEWVKGQPPSDWLGLNVFSTKEGELFVFPEKTTETRCDQNLHVERSTLAELKAIYCEGQSYTSLKEFFQQFPRNRFWLRIRSNSYGIHKEIVKVIKEANASERVILNSDYPVIVSSVRKLNSNLVFASGAPDETRMMVLHSLYLEPLWGPDTDIVTLHWKKFGSIQLDERLLKELRRQKKKVFVISPTVNNFNNLDVDGVILSNAANL